MKWFFTALRGFLAALFLFSIAFLGLRLVAAARDSGHFRTASSYLTDTESLPSSRSSMAQENADTPPSGDGLSSDSEGEAGLADGQAAAGQDLAGSDGLGQASGDAQGQDGTGTQDGTAGQDVADSDGLGQASGGVKGQDGAGPQDGTAGQDVAGSEGLGQASGGAQGQEETGAEGGSAEQGQAGTGTQEGRAGQQGQAGSDRLTDDTGQGREGSAEQDSTHRTVGLLDFMTASPEPETTGLTGFNYNSLDEDTRRLYRQLYTGISREKEYVFISACETNDAGRALNALLNDHPEFFWMDGKASVYGLKGAPVVQIIFDFNLPAEEIPAARAAIEGAAAEFEASLPEGAGDYDKVKAAYEYIVKTTDYDWELTGVHSQNIQSVFIDHLSVCAGYAMAFKYLLDRQDIPCAFLSGTTASPNGSTESHAWNLVTIDGVMTYVDVTWGDPAYLGETAADQDFVSYDYLCLTSEEMARTGHTLDDTCTAPVCEDRTYDYYILNDCYSESFDTDKVSRALMNAVDNNRNEVRFKFGSAEAYQEAAAALFEGGLVSEALQNRMIWDNLSSITYFNQCSDRLYTIRVFW